MSKTPSPKRHRRPLRSFELFDDLADLADRVGHAGRRLIGLGEDRFDRRIFLEGRFNLLRFYRVSPLDLDLLRLNAVGRADFPPTFAEFSAIDEEGFVAGRENW